MRFYLGIMLVMMSLKALAVGEKFDSKNLVQAYDKFIIELDRLNGDGLIPRQNRKKSFSQVSKELRRDLVKAKTKFEAGRIFARLDAAYTNNHSYADLSAEYSYKKSEGALKLAVSLQPDLIFEDGKVERYTISSVDESSFETLSKDERPKIGDEIVAINKRPMSSWSDENFEFCKFPLRSQCELELFDNLKNELLSWHRKQKLNITFVRNKKKLTIDVPFAIKEKSESKAEDRAPCEVNEVRYKSFKLVYKGYNACLYERSDKPGFAVLRLASFRYRNVAESYQIKNVHDEANKFNKEYWSKHSKNLNTFVIDVVDNYGGDTVVPWVEIFATASFQDQFVEFKNIKEFANENYRKAALYEDLGKIAIINKWKKDGYYDTVPVGGFFKPMSQFCSSQDESCLEKKWPAVGNNFKGQFFLITNNWCISSCSGFVWTMKNTLGDRLNTVGVPDSADTTYTRASIEVRMTSQAPFYELVVEGRSSGRHKNLVENAVVKQVVSVTRSTNQDASIVSGQPVKTNYFNAPRWDEDGDMWVNRILTSAPLN